MKYLKNWLIIAFWLIVTAWNTVLVFYTMDEPETKPKPQSICIDRFEVIHPQQKVAIDTAGRVWLRGNKVELEGE